MLDSDCSLSAIYTCIHILPMGHNGPAIGPAGPAGYIHHNCVYPNHIYWQHHSMAYCAPAVQVEFASFAASINGVFW